MRKHCIKKLNTSTPAIISVSYTHLDVYKRQHLHIIVKTCQTAAGKNIKI